jgi:hypothetical protein
MLDIHSLVYLLQLESFQNTIQQLLYKIGENRQTILAYVAGGIITLLLIYRFLARTK